MGVAMTCHMNVQDAIACGEIGGVVVDDTRVIDLHL
jgi:hypothetical protein